LTNTGNSTLNLLKYGTFLDSAPVEKAIVLSGSKYYTGRGDIIEIISIAMDLNMSYASLGVELTYSIETKQKLPFGGILARYNLANLTLDAFITIPAGKSYVTSLDLASLHDLSTGGEYIVLSEGAVPYFEGTAPTSADLILSKALTFKSNILTIAVDGSAAAKVKPVFTPINQLDKRVTISSCSGSSQTALVNALANARKLADAAAVAAQSGSESKFREYFKDSSPATRSTVAARLRAVSKAASSTNSGVSYYCRDLFFGKIVLMKAADKSYEAKFTKAVELVFWHILFLV
jgi:deuterolysin